MWTISEEDIYLRMNFFLLLCVFVCIDKDMSLISKNEQAEQIWSLFLLLND